MVAADTQQNIKVMLQLLFEHNGLAILFAFGAILALAYAIYRPSRGSILFMIGWILLLFAFEYAKHIADPLIEQTTNSLITERQSWRLAWFVEKILGRALPPLLYLAGFGSLVLGGYLMKFKPAFKLKLPFINFKKEKSA